MTEYRSQKKNDPVQSSHLTVLPVLLLVAAGFLVTAALINEYVTKPYWRPYLGNYSLRLAALSEYGRSVNAVFVGSSHMVTDINPRIVDAASGGQLRSFNLSIIASSLAAERYSLKFLVDAELPNLRYVFLEPMLMPVAYRKNAFTARARYFWNLENTRIAARKRWNTNLPLWQRVVDSTAMGFMWLLHMANFGAVPDIVNPQLPNKDLTEAAWKARGHSPWQSANVESDFTRLPDLDAAYRARSESELRVIDEYLQFVDTAGAEPIFLFPPARRDVGRLRAFRDAVVRRYPGVLVIDYLPDANPLPLYFEKSLWGDHDHLNQAGAREFSKLLASDIEQLGLAKAVAEN
jgi:hypothetical protein